MGLYGWCVCAVLCSTFFYVCSANSILLSPGQPVTVFSPSCSEYSYFIFPASKWCQDILISVQTPSGSAFQPIISASPTPMNSPLDDVTWKNVNPFDLTLRIPAREPKYAVGNLYIAVYIHCLTPNATSGKATALAFNLTAQHVPWLPLPGVPTLTPFQWMSFTLSTPEAYWPFEFCQEPADFNNCPLDITVEMQNAAPVCPISIVSNDVQYPTRKNLAWSVGCGTLAIPAQTPLASPGFYYGTFNSWCTPDYYCADPTNCFPCSQYNVTTNQAASLRLNFTCNPGAAPSPSYIAPVPLPMIADATGVLHGSYTGAVDCTSQNNKTMYFSVVVSDPCVDLSVEVIRVQGQFDLLISRNGIKNPSFSTLIWPDWWWGNNNVTISHTDQNFAPDTFYITVAAYCGTDATTYNPYPIFNLKITQTPVGLGFAPTATQEGGRLLSVSGTALAANYAFYEVCISPSLQSQYAIAAIQYTDLDSSGNAVTVSVSESNGVVIDNEGGAYAFPLVLVDQFIQYPVAETASYHLYVPLLYQLGASGGRQPLVLWNHTSPQSSNNLTGYFYLAVYGRCYPQGQCGGTNFIGCSLCQNYPSKFNVQLILQQSPLQPSSTVDSDSSSKTYSGGQVAGITIGVAIGFGLIVSVVILCAYERTKWCANRYKTVSGSKRAGDVNGHVGDMEIGEGKGRDTREQSISTLRVH